MKLLIFAFYVLLLIAMMKPYLVRAQISEDVDDDDDPDNNDGFPFGDEDFPFGDDDLDF